MEATPTDLVDRGVYQHMAVPLNKGDYRTVSFGQVCARSPCNGASRHHGLLARDSVVSMRRVAQAAKALGASVHTNYRLSANERLRRISAKEQATEDPSDDRQDSRSRQSSALASPIRKLDKIRNLKVQVALRQLPVLPRATRESRSSEEERMRESGVSSA